MGTYVHLSEKLKYCTLDLSMDIGHRTLYIKCRGGGGGGRLEDRLHTRPMNIKRCRKKVTCRCSHAPYADERARSCTQVRKTNLKNGLKGQSCE